MNLMADARLFHVVQHAHVHKFVEKPYAGGHASAPVLLVLSGLAIAGLVAASIFVPAAVAPMIVATAILMVGAVGLALFSLYATGEIIEARFDKGRNCAQLLYRGPTAHTVWDIPLNRISGARMAMRYDENGAKVATPELELTNGRTIDLPASTTWQDIEAIRALIAEDTSNSDAAWARKASVRQGARTRGKNTR